MRRSASLRHVLAVAIPILIAGGVPAFGDPPAPAAPAGKAAPPPAVLATEVQVEDALAKFKEDFKAKGLKGDDRTSQRDFAMAALGKLQHPRVVEALGDVSRENDATLRTIAVIYLGDQTLSPGPAGARVVAAMQRGKDDAVLLMSGLQSLGKLKYLGARDEIRALMKDQAYPIKKAAILAVGQTGDLRLMGDMLSLIGVRLPEANEPPPKEGNATGKDASGKEVVTQGYSWEGAEASVDTGDPSNADQLAAEQKVKDQLAANQRAASEGHGGGGGGGVGGDGAAGGGKGGASRTPKELVPYVLAALKKLTGQGFNASAAFLKWYGEHRNDVADKDKVLDGTEKDQKAAAAAKAK